MKNSNSKTTDETKEAKAEAALAREALSTMITIIGNIACELQRVSGVLQAAAEMHRVREDHFHAEIVDDTAYLIERNRERLEKLLFDGNVDDAIVGLGIPF